MKKNVSSLKTRADKKEVRWLSEIQYPIRRNDDVQSQHFYHTPHESSAELFGLKFLTRFKIVHVMVCAFMEKRLRYHLPGIVINNKEIDGFFCC